MCKHRICNACAYLLKCCNVKGVLRYETTNSAEVDNFCQLKTYSCHIGSLGKISLFKLSIRIMKACLQRGMYESFDRVVS